MSLDLRAWLGGDWTEELHPRGEGGKFTSGDDGGDERAKYERAVEAVKMAPSVSRGMEPDFPSEHFGYPQQGPPDGFTTEEQPEGRRSPASTDIGGYDADGNLVSTFSIATSGPDEGAFKVSVRDDAQRQGYGGKILAEAERQGFDLAAVADKNRYTSEGRALLLSYFGRRAEQGALLASWDESLHPRGEGGRFTTGDSEGTIDDRRMGPFPGAPNVNSREGYITQDDATYEAIERWGGHTANWGDLGADARIQAQAERIDAGEPTNASQDAVDARALLDALDSPDAPRSDGELYRGVSRGFAESMVEGETVHWALAPASWDRGVATGYFGGKGLVTIEPGVAGLPVGGAQREAIIRGDFVVKSVSEEMTLNSDVYAAVTLTPVDARTASWDESLHPRGEGGRFGEKESDSVEEKASGPQAPMIGPPTGLGRGEGDIRNTRLGHLAARYESGLFTNPATGHPLKPDRADAEMKSMTARGVQERMTSVATADLYAATERGMNAPKDPADLAGFRWEPHSGWQPGGEALMSDAIRHGDEVMLNPAYLMHGEDRGVADLDMLASRERLSPSPEEFDVIVRDYAASQMIAQWADTSNDQNATSLAMQEAAVREFGLTDTYPWKMDEAKRAEVDGVTAEHGAVYEAFLRAQYEGTQELFRDAGVTSIDLYRGMSLDPTRDARLLPEESTQTIDLRPISSFSTSPDTADRFGGADVQVRVSAEVPAERILSTAGTGFGCYGEGEFTVLGGANSEFTVQHDRTYTDQVVVAHEAAVGWLADAQNSGTVPEGWKAPGNGSYDEATGVYSFVVQDQYTSYSRIIEAQFDSTTGSLNLPAEAEGSGTTVRAEAGLYDPVARQADDAAAMAGVSLPEGWVARIDPGYPGDMPRAVVDAPNGDQILGKFYNEVDSGFGVTEFGAQRFADTAIAVHIGDQMVGAIAAGNSPPGSVIFPSPANVFVEPMMVATGASLNGTMPAMLSSTPGGASVATYGLVNVDREANEVSITLRGEPTALFAEGPLTSPVEVTHTMPLDEYEADMTAARAVTEQVRDEVWHGMADLSGGELVIPAGVG